MTYEEIIKLVDERIDMQTDIIMESDWFDEKVQEAVKEYLETNQLWNISKQNLTFLEMKW